MDAKLVTQKRSNANSGPVPYHPLSVIGWTAIGLGISTLVAGLSMAICYAIVPMLSVLRDISTFFLVSAIPVLLIGSHLLDLAERRKNNASKRDL